jgi:hypothetical protein
MAVTADTVVAARRRHDAADLLGMPQHPSRCRACRSNSRSVMQVSYQGPDCPQPLSVLELALTGTHQAPP